MHENEILDILRSRIFPALGCTDPVVVAYAASIAKSAFEHAHVEEVVLTVDKNIYKNALRVTIPKTDLKGLEYACALGIYGGDHRLQLQVLQGVGEDDIARAIELVDKKAVKIIVRKESGLFIEIELKTSIGRSRCRIEESYTNLTLLEVEGRLLSFDGENITDQARIPSIENLTLDHIFDFIDRCPTEKLSFVEEGCRMNLAIAEEGLKGSCKGFFGQAIKKAFVNNEAPNVVMQIKMLTAAAADMRMSGADMPVMATAGSGNQGITALTPVAALAGFINAPQEKMIRAATLSHLITIYIKEKIGILSHVCGCSIAAGAGSSAGMTYLLGGSRLDIENAVTNTIGGLAGMICDGAKGGCAMKLSISAGTAAEAAYLALEGAVIPAYDGIVAGDLATTIDNLAHVFKIDQGSVDDSILDVMYYANDILSIINSDK